MMRPKTAFAASSTLARERKFFCKSIRRFFALLAIKTALLFAETATARLPEAIDALLHVADEEQPVLPRKAADDGLPESRWNPDIRR